MNPRSRTTQPSADAQDKREEMSETLRVVAHLRAQEGKEVALGELLEGLVEPTHAEEGCISYELLAHSENAAEYTFVEEWRGPEDLEAHFETPHLKHAMERLPDLLAAELDLRTYHKVR